MKLLEREQLRLHLASHWFAYVAALVIGFVMILPQVLFIIQAGPRYQGINIFETDAEYYYISRIQEVYDGHYTIANSILAQGKDMPYVQPPLGELIMGGIGKLFNLDIATLLVTFRFAASALLFLLVYWFALLLSRRDRLASVVAASAVLLGSNLVSHPTDLLLMIRGTFDAQLFIDYARPINPQISSLFLFGFLVTLVRLFQTRHIVSAAIAAVLYGLSFYVYPYTWTFLSVVIGLSALWLLLKRRWWLFGLICTIGVTGLVIAIPYFINTVAVVNHPSYEMLHSTWGLLNAHTPVFSITIVAGLFFATVLYWLKKDDRLPASVIALLFFSGAVAINQQVITGKELYYGHYHWYFVKPFFALSGSLVLFELLRRIRVEKYVRFFVFVTACSILVYNGIMIQRASYRHYYDSYLSMQRYGDVINWVNKNTERDEVAYVPQSFFFPLPDRSSLLDYPSVTLSRLIVSYTPLNLYFSRYANFYLFEDVDYKTFNLYIVLKLLAIPPDQVFSYLRNHPDIFSDYYLAYFKERGQTFNDIPNEWITTLANDYRFFHSLSWEEIWQRYPVNYIIWDKGDLPNLPFYDINNQLNIYEEVYNQDEISVLKFR